jgi:hypothetical protein
MTNLQRYRLQLDWLCRKLPTVPHHPLTGIEKQQLEEDEAQAMWQELEARDDR